MAKLCCFWLYETGSIQTHNQTRADQTTCKLQRILWMTTLDLYSCCTVSYPKNTPCWRLLLMTFLKTFDLQHNRFCNWGIHNMKYLHNWQEVGIQNGERKLYLKSFIDILNISCILCWLFLFSLHCAGFPCHYKQTHLDSFSCRCPWPQHWWRTGAGPWASSVVAHYT